MRRTLVCLGLLICSLSLQASLHPGWRQAGWLTDYDIARQQARLGGKPVFLYFDASWCSWCQQYKREVLDTEAVQRALAGHYIRLVIDYDARPDLFKHYRGRGLPFTVILAADGSVRNRFVGILKTPDLLATLRQFSGEQTETAAAFTPVFGPVVPTGLDRQAYGVFRDAYLRHIDALYSPELQTLAGQYDTGTTLKRPSPLTWMWLMEQPRWQDRALQAAQVEAKRLWDHVDGGFFQYLHVRPVDSDYRESSKLLEVNARLSQWLARAARRDPRLGQYARGGMQYLLQQLRDPQTGAFFQAQNADQAYYRLPPGERRRRPAPPLDRIIRVDTNAQAIIAMVDAGRWMQDEKLSTIAARAWRFLATGMIEDHRLYHLYKEGRLEVPALIDDELWLLAAGLELQHAMPDSSRARLLRGLARKLRQRIEILRKDGAAASLSPDLCGLLAWVAIDPAVANELGNSWARWALRGLALEPETPPDNLVYGLRAWHRLLENKIPGT